MDIKKEVIRKLKGKKPIFKISCEYYVRAKDKEDAENFAIEELSDGEFYERHIIIEESDCEEGDIFKEIE